MIDPLDSAYRTGALTHTGNVRRANEDSLLARPDIGLWAVSDGMGGHEAGAFASAAIVEALSACRQRPSAGALLRDCEDNLAAANARIRACPAALAGATVGATVAVLLTFGEHYACLWCGDSRVYLVRDGAIRQLSRDHSEVQELVDQGALTPEEARTWPGRNVLTRAVGVFDEAETEMTEGRLESGDIFVLCSDGLTTHVNDEEILRAVMRRAALGGCQDLIDLALERGGRDNVTVIVVHYRPDRTRRLRPPRVQGEG
jgi:protein phosphatase